MPFWARKTRICAFFKPLNIWSSPLFWGGPRPYFQPPFPPITPALLFTSEVSVFYQHGFPYLFQPSCVSFCGTWYTVCSVLMCFGELCSAANRALPPSSPPPPTHTRKHMDMFPAMVGNIGEGCLCVFPLISIISHIHFEHYLKVNLGLKTVGLDQWYHKISTPLFQFPDVAVGADLGCSHLQLSFLHKPLYNPPTRQEGIPA